MYAMRADRDDRPELALLYRAIASSQEMQARRFLVQCRGSMGTTAENEETAFASELPAFIGEYEALLTAAEKEGSKALATGFRHSRTVQERNLELHAILARRDRDAVYHVCDFCGYIAGNNPPENCPVCTAPERRFIRIAAD